MLNRIKNMLNKELQSDEAKVSAHRRVLMKKLMMLSDMDHTTPILPRDVSSRPSRRRHSPCTEHKDKALEVPSAVLGALPQSYRPFG